MTAIISPSDGLLFMKVGLHAGETFEEIIERKRREYETAGKAFWGYGGGTCHPTRHVLPFANIQIEQGKDIYLVMQEIESHHPPKKVVAKEYSIDGVTWEKIPRGIEVLSSRYALVLGEINEGDLDLDLSHYEVAAGPSAGKPASEYVKGRVDKACISWAENLPANLPEVSKVIAYFAEIQSPYAVFMR